MDDLNDKLLSELKKITEELDIKGASKLSCLLYTSDAADE